MTYDLQLNKQTVNNKALAWTVGVHLLLFLLLFFLRYNIATPVQPTTVDTGGLEVNLGTSDNGSGKDQPMSTKSPAAYQAAVVYKSVASKSSLPKDIVRSTEADAPEVDNTKHKKTVVAPTPTIAEKSAPPKPVEKPKY